MPGPTHRITVEQLHEQIEALLEDTQSGKVLSASSRVESLLQDLLGQGLPNLSKTLEAKLFTGFGPLSSFSAKIDVAYAMAKIDAKTRQDLHAIREIRNAFAHAKELVTCRSPDVCALVEKLSSHKKGQDPYKVFVDAIFECSSKLIERLNRGALAAALMKYTPPKPDTSK